MVYNIKSHPMYTYPVHIYTYESTKYLKGVTWILKVIEKCRECAQEVSCKCPKLIQINKI